MRGVVHNIIAYERAMIQFAKAMEAGPAELVKGYIYDTSVSRYRNLATGRLVSRSRIIDLMESSTASRARSIQQGTVAMMEERISPSTWLSRSSSMLKREYLQQAALGAGGWDRLTPADYGRIGGRLRGEYGRMARLAQEVRDGTVTPAQALNRIDMYMGNARQQFWLTERERLSRPKEGMATLERRILDKQAQNCPDCITYYDQGWQPAGVLPVPSQACVCDGNCRCTLERREVPEAQVRDMIGSKR